MRISEDFARDYLKTLFLCYFYVLILRSLEFYFVSKNQIVEELFENEIIGLIVDFFIVNTLSVFILLIQYFFRKSYQRFGQAFLISFIALICFLHLLILQYYIYLLVPLDKFLFKNSYQELIFTITTFDVNYPAILFLIIVLVSIALFFPKLIFNHIRIPARKFTWFLLPILISIPLSVYSIWKIDSDENDVRRNIRMNKSLFFYRKTCSYLLEGHKDIELSSTQIQKFQSVFSGKEYMTEEYPLLHKENLNDVIGDFFASSDTFPNFVFLIVEGLSQAFLNSFHGVQIMPYLDSLSGQSLYWDRFFTTGERSFAVVPSITGSLPYGEHGFMEMEPLPRHITLVSLLKKFGYQSHFFYGLGAWFHQKDRFFEANDIDLIIDKSDFSSKYEKVMAQNGRFFWGYQDADLLQQSLEILDTLPYGPRIDLYFTGSMHSPFPTDNPEYYYNLLDSLTAISNVSGMDQKLINKYQKYLISVMFFDRALEQFMKEYEKQDDFNRTIFIITGDHPMTEIPVENSIKRYNVPLIIYSPLLNRSKRIHATGSHLDVYPTILAFLRDNYNFSIPETYISLGYCLDTVKNFRNLYPVPFMNGNREIIDFIQDAYYLSHGDRIYQVDADLNLSVINDTGKLRNLQNNLEVFNRVNLYVSKNDKLIPDSIYFRDLGISQVSSANR